VRDYDYHPDEPDVRVFGVPESGVLVRTDDMYLAQTCEPGSSEPTAPPLALRHPAFADEWFKLNATFNMDGDLIETGPAEERFTINCDVATPLTWVGSDATAVDLFLDVLVFKDGNYRVVDHSEFEDACSRQLISSTEAEYAVAGLTRLIHWITSGRLHDLVSELPRHVVGDAPPPLPFYRSPLAAVPAVAPYLRPTW
jgi:hypothetical protein